MDSVVSIGPKKRVSVQQFREERATFDADMGYGEGNEITVTYNPARITAALDAELRRYIRAGEPEAAAKVLCKVVIDWDLYGPFYAEVPIEDEKGKIRRDEDGIEMTERKLLVGEDEKMPLKPQVLRYVESSRLLALWLSIQKHRMPDFQLRT
jgi:hypothetical protein